MTQLEMIELVQQHHSHLGETELRKLLDRALSDFAAKTEVLETSYTTSTVANQRYYTIPSTLLKIKNIWLNDVLISRLVGKPIIDDDTAETG
jgi:hypothetical protein